LHAAPTLAAQPSVRLGAQVKLLVCSHEMCIPGKAELSLTLPIKSQPPAPNTATAELFAATRKLLPRPAPGNWKFSVTDANDSFVLTANVGRQVTQAIFFPLAESQIANAAPQKLVTEKADFRLTLRKSDQLLKPIDRLKGVLALSDDQAFLIDVPIGKAGAVRSSGNGRAK